MVRTFDLCGFCFIICSTVSVVELEKQEDPRQTTSSSFIIQFTSNGNELFTTEVEAGNKEKASANEVLGNFRIEDEIEVVLMTRNHSDGEVTFFDKLKIPIICLDRNMPSPLTVIEDGVELDILFNIIDDSHLTDELLFASFDQKLQQGEEEEEEVKEIMIEDEQEDRTRERDGGGREGQLIKEESKASVETAVEEEDERYERMLEMMSPEDNLVEGKKKLSEREERRRKVKVWRLRSVQIYQALKLSCHRILASDSAFAAIELLQSITDFLSAASKFIFMVIVDLSVEFLKLMDSLLCDFLQHVDSIVDRFVEGSIEKFLEVCRRLMMALWMQYRALHRSIKNQQNLMLAFTKNLVHFSVVKANPLLRIIVRRAQPLVEAGSPIINPVTSRLNSIRKSRLLEGNRFYGSFLSKVIHLGEELLEEAVTAYDEENHQLSHQRHLHLT